MIASGEDDDDATADEDTYDSPAFIVHDTTSQESTSIFYTKPFYIGAIDGASINQLLEYY